MGIEEELNCEYCGKEILDMREGYEDGGEWYCCEDCMIEDSKDPEKDEFN